MEDFRQKYEDSPLKVRKRKKNPQRCSSKRCSKDVKRRSDNPAECFLAKVQNFFVIKPKVIKREKTHGNNSAKKSEHVQISKTLAVEFREQ